VIEPYTFMRGVTIALATTWTVMSVVRIVRFAGRMKRRLAPLGCSEEQWRRWLTIACLRATVLDPTNLALMCLLVAIWTIGGSLRH
jgi:hypothetical protein